GFAARLNGRPPAEPLPSHFPSPHPLSRPILPKTLTDSPTTMISSSVNMWVGGSIRRPKLASRQSPARLSESLHALAHPLCCQTAPPPGPPPGPPGPAAGRPRGAGRRPSVLVPVVRLGGGPQRPGGHPTAEPHAGPDRDHPDGDPGRRVRHRDGRRQD